MKWAIDRKLRELEYRFAAHGLGDGFCECGSGISLDKVVKLMGGQDGALEAWEELNRCKSDVHNPRPPGARRPPVDMDKVHLHILGGVDGVKALIDELEKLAASPPAVPPWVAKTPSLTEPTLPEKVAEAVKTKSLAEMLLLPEDEAAAGSRALQRAWGQDAPEPEAPAPKVEPVIEPLDEEPFGETVKRVSVYAEHETMADKLKGLLERTKV